MALQVVLSSVLDWMDIHTLLLFVFVFLLISDHLRNRSPKNFPPGPWALPFVGNLFNTDAKQPHIHFKELAKRYGNVFSLHVGGVRTVVINGYSLVKEALIVQGSTFAARPDLPLHRGINKCQGMAFNTGYSWKQQRRFTVSTLRNFGVGKSSLESRIMEEFTFLHQAMLEKKGEPFDAHFLVNGAVSNIICSVVFGRRFEYTDKQFLLMLKLMSTALKIEAGMWAQAYNSFPFIMKLLPGPHKEMFSCFRQVCDFLREEIAHHQKDWDPSTPRNFIDCYLGEIEKRRDDPEAGFHEEGLCYCMLDLFVAGTETTSTTLLWAFLYMMKHPDIQEKVQAEIDRVVGQSRQPTMADRANMPYTDAVIHEVQRIGNIVPLNVLRSTSEDTTLGGYFLPKGTLVIANLTSVLFDEKEWKSPNSFDPGRFLNKEGELVKIDAFLPFSAGKRICLGEPLARMELFLFFVSILQKFTIRPPEGTQVSLDFEFGITLCPKPFKLTVIADEAVEADIEDYLEDIRFLFEADDTAAVQDEASLEEDETAAGDAKGVKWVKGVAQKLKKMKRGMQKFCNRFVKTVRRGFCCRVSVEE
ncbi:hypothetical protein AGOR_G00150110 [Albula goreensis]|uniref:Cytochrome P450 n=1 Tax=Albula goreensis TaxID=1534307 RepID=A0A8T3D7M2_9TELE|nr:hypothetical protein AGOR_G00150110 [Albula goreensis]